MGTYVDLHIHTHFSDGSDSPEGVARRAAAAGLVAVAVTDHDTVAGLDESEQAVRDAGLEFMPGVEISATYGETEVHIVGLGIDRHHEDLLLELGRLVKGRSDRVDQMVAKLALLGVPVTRADVETQASGAAALGRMHVAHALMAQGVTRTLQEGFDKYLRAGRRAYVPRKIISCKRAIELIQTAGGLAFLAHPGVGVTVSRVLDRLLALPFDGLEVYHTRHTPGHITQFTQAALERDLLISGGSDCHGKSTDPTACDLGKVRVPYHHFDRIKAALEARRPPRTSA